jgi:YesN/AraC family two-component response regulator
VELGVTDFLAKPVDLDQLCGVLSGLFDRVNTPARSAKAREEKEVSPRA